MSNEHLLKINWEAVAQTIKGLQASNSAQLEQIIILQQQVAMLTQQLQSLQTTVAVLNATSRGYGPTSR